VEKQITTINDKVTTLHDFNKSYISRKVNKLVYDKMKGLLKKSASLQNLPFSAKARQGEARISNVVNFFTKVKENIVLLKGTTLTGTTIKGAERPNHKYIERRPAKDGNGYIYRYELPNGRRKWEDENGGEVDNYETRQGQDIQKGLVTGDMIKQGDRVGTVKEVADSVIAVDFGGKIETIFKKELFTNLSNLSAVFWADNKMHTMSGGKANHNEIFYAFY